MDKTEMRQIARARLHAMPERERLEKSEQVRARLFSLPEFKKSRAVMFYASTRYEVHTPPMIIDALNAGKTVLLPKIAGDGIVPCEVSDFDELVPGRFNILEPTGSVFPVSDIGLFVVPGLAFGEDCGRIGRGLGYYDRFQAAVPGRGGGASGVKFIALAFESQIFKSVPSYQHDVRMDLVVTEKRLLAAKPR